MEKIGKTNDNLNICKLTDAEMAFVELAMSIGQESKKVEAVILDEPARKKQKRRKIFGRVKRLPKAVRYRKFVEVDGDKLTRMEVSKKFNIPYVTVCGRINKGWPDNLVINPARGGVN